MLQKVICDLIRMFSWLCVHTHRKLLTPPTAPCDQNALVGMATATLDDLQQIMPVCVSAWILSALNPRPCENLLSECQRLKMESLKPEGNFDWTCFLRNELFVFVLVDVTFFGAQLKPHSVRKSNRRTFICTHCLKTKVETLLFVNISVTVWVKIRICRD